MPLASLGLNYNSLMSGEDPLAVLSPFLAASNIHVVANLANHIPNSTGGCLTPSELYRHFAEKLFWEGEVGREGEQSSSCLVRYENCLEYLVLLAASDLLEFVKGITATERALIVSLKFLKYPHCCTDLPDFLDALLLGVGD